VLPGTANEVLGAHYLDVAELATPANPAAATRRQFVDPMTHKLSVRTSAGATVSLEEQAGAGTLPTDNLDKMVLGSAATTPKWVYVAPAALRTDFTLMPYPDDLTKWAVYKSKDSTAYHVNADAGVVISATALDISPSPATASKLGGTIGWGNYVPLKSTALLQAGVWLVTEAGWSKPSNSGSPLLTHYDSVGALMYAATGFVGDWLVHSPAGADNCGINGGQFDVDSKNATTNTLGYGCIGLVGNRVHVERVGTYGNAAKSDTDSLSFGCLLGLAAGGGGSNGADDFVDDCDFRTNNNGVAFWCNGADLNISHCHIHGCGKSVAQMAYFGGSNTKFGGGMHFEAGGVAAPTYLCTLDAPDMQFRGWLGQNNGSNGLQLTSAFAGSVAADFAPSGIPSLPTWDAMVIAAVTRPVTIDCTTDYEGAVGTNTYRYAFNIASSTAPILIHSYAGVGTQALPWNRRPMGYPAGTLIHGHGGAYALVP